MKKQSENKLVKAFLHAKDEILIESQIEIIGNREIIVQGAKGIIEYSDEQIRINVNDMEVRFSGEKLAIECLSQDSLEIKGIIRSIEYV